MKRILTAIPRSWKDIIKSADTQTEWNRPQLNLYVENTDGEQIDILQPTLTTKMIYKTVKNKLFIRPYVEASWQQRFGIDIDWKIAWKQKVKLDDRKLAQFNYKLLHNILPNRKQLKIWKIIQDDKCVLCRITEDPEHLFTLCK